MIVDTGPPPAIYDYAPTPAPIVVPVRAMPPWCAQFRACAAIYPGVGCVIWILDVEKGATRAQILRHEYGHCNSWPAAHPR